MSSYTYPLGVVFTLFLIVSSMKTSGKNCLPRQYYAEEVGKCLNCSLLCGSPKDKPEICLATCQALEMEVKLESSKCPKWYHYEHAVGKCIECSITCGNKPKCPTICKGWDEILKATSTQLNATGNTAQQNETQHNQLPMLILSDKSDSAGAKAEANINKEPPINLMALAIGGSVAFLLVIGVIIGIYFTCRRRGQQANNLHIDVEEGHAGEQEGLNLDNPEQDLEPVQEEGEGAEEILMHEVEL